LHEAGLLAAAVAEALAARPHAGEQAGRVPLSIGIRVHDPMHVAPESALAYAEVALRSHGIDGVPITVIADPVTCAICDTVNEVRADHPFCSDCGFPLPDRGGHAVDVAIDWGTPA
jgi:hypothetical protein